MLTLLLALLQTAAVGDKVADFSVSDTAGKTWTLSELAKRTPSGVVCLTYWCTFCHSCRKLDATLPRTAEDFRGKAAVLGVDASALDTPERIEAFIKEKKFTLPVFLDGGKVADLFGVTVTTTTLVVDKDGVLRYRGRFEGGVEALKALLDGKDIPVKETPPAG
jgi:peroxiredoxin